MMLRLKFITPKHLDLKVWFHFVDKEGTEYIAVVPVHDKHWYDMTLLFSESQRLGQEVYLTEFTLKPNTRQIDETKETKFKMEQAPKYTTRPVEKERKDLE